MAAPVPSSRDQEHSATAVTGDSSGSHDGSSPLCWEVVLPRPPGPVHVPTLSSPPHWLRVTNNKLREDAARIAAVAFRQAHDSLYTHERIALDTIFNSVTAGEVSLAIPAPRLFISYQTEVTPGFSETSSQSRMLRAGCSIDPRSLAREAEQEADASKQPGAQHGTTNAPSLPWNQRLASRERAKRRRERWKTSSRFRRPEQYFVGKGITHQTLSASQQDPTGRPRPSAASNQKREILHEGEERDLDELYQRSQRQLSASVAASHLAMDTFLYELARMNDAILDLEVDISTAKADLRKIEAKHTEAEKFRNAAILQFQITYVGSFPPERPAAENAMDFSAATVRRRIVSTSEFAESPTKKCAMPILYELDERILRYESRLQALAAAKIRAETELQQLLDSFEEAVVEHQQTRAALKQRFEDANSQEARTRGADVNGRTHGGR